MTLIIIVIYNHVLFSHASCKMKANDQQDLSVAHLQSVLDQIANQLPAWRGQLRVQDHEPAQQVALAHDLFTHWQAAQPLAGQPYWSARSWGMLMWQPAYLAVLAVHFENTALDLRGVWQSAHAGATHGLTLPEQPIRQGETNELIAEAAQFLLDYHQQHYAHLIAIQAYSAKQAACMTVDCVLSALLLPHRELGWTEAQLALHTSEWLAALQMQRHGNLMQIALPNGQTAPALNRQGCCQHFRLPGELACNSCPRWPMPIRIEKIRQELINND